LVQIIEENVAPEKPRRRSALCFFFCSLPAHAMWFVIGGVWLQLGRFVVDVLYQFSEHLEQ